MSTPAVLTGELLELVSAARTIADAYTALHAANERGVTGADLNAFSVAMTTVKAAETEIGKRWFPRAASVTVSGVHPEPTLMVVPNRGQPRLIDGGDR